MKKMLLIAVGVTLSTLTACISVQPIPQNQTDPGTSILEKLQLVSSKGCNALPELERRLLVMLINSQIPDYPDNGLCDPQWVQKELIKQIDKLESTTNTTPWLRANPLVDLTPEDTELNYAA